MADKYDELIDEARVEYAVASAAAREAHGKVAALNVEMGEVQEELGSLRERLAAFEAGRLAMSPEEFAAGLDRERWLQGRVRGLGGMVKAAAGPAQAAGAQVTNVAMGWRSRLGEMLARDVAEMRARRVGQLEEVLRE